MGDLSRFESGRFLCLAVVFSLLLLEIPCSAALSSSSAVVESSSRGSAEDVLGSNDPQNQPEHFPVLEITVKGLTDVINSLSPQREPQPQAREEIDDRSNSRNRRYAAMTDEQKAKLQSDVRRLKTARSV